MSRKRMPRFAKILSLMVLGLLLWFVVSFKHWIRFPHIISRWYAKEFCSCTFVMKREASFCEERVSQWIPLQNYRVDSQLKRVTAKGLWMTAHAEWISEDEGCRLVDTEISPY